MTMRLFRSYLVSSLIFLTCTSVFASPTPPRSRLDHNGVKYPWSIGIGGIFTLNAYKDTKNTYLVLPFIGYRGERLSINGPMVAYKVIKTKTFTLSGQAYLFPEKFSPHDSTDPKLRQLNPRHYSLMTGLKTTYNVSQLQRLSLSLSRSMIGATNGYSTIGQYQLTIPIFSHNGLTLIQPGVGVSWQSKKLVDYYYGITPSETAKSTLQTYQPRSAFLPMASLSLAYIYKKRWSALLLIKTTRLPNAIYHSPMVDKRYLTSCVIVFSYLF